MPAYYHGTPAELSPGELIEPGHPPAWPQSRPGLTYFTTSRKDARAWGRDTHVYLVTPAGSYEPDPNFPDGDIAVRELPNGLRIEPARGKGRRMSYQTAAPLRVLRELF